MEKWITEHYKKIIKRIIDIEKAPLQQQQSCPIISSIKLSTWLKPQQQQKL